MEQVAAAVDAETYRKLRGLRCHLQHCGKIVTGYIDEQKTHFRTIHKINTSHVANFPFICSDCDSLYKRFKYLKRHIVEIQSRSYNYSNNFGEEHENQQILPERPSPSGSNLTIQTVQNDLNYSGITNIMFIETYVSTPEMTQLAEQYVMKMCCDVGLPESKIKDFMDTTTDLIVMYMGDFS